MVEGGSKTQLPFFSIVLELKMRDDIIMIWVLHQRQVHIGPSKTPNASQTGGGQMVKNLDRRPLLVIVTRVFIW